MVQSSISYTVVTFASFSLPCSVKHSLVLKHAQRNCLSDEKWFKFFSIQKPFENQHWWHKASSSGWLNTRRYPATLIETIVVTIDGNRVTTHQVYILLPYNKKNEIDNAKLGKKKYISYFDRFFIIFLYQIKFIQHTTNLCSNSVPTKISVAKSIEDLAQEMIESPKTKKLKKAISLQYLSKEIIINSFSI